jgi:NADH:ubiquinone oxidoreductase subunit 6 (subunit J)
MSLAEDSRTISTLFGNAIEQLGKLVHNEVQLARAEILEKIARAAKGVVLLGAAAILAVPVLVLLLIALATWLNQLGISPVGSYLIAAGVGAVISAILALIGLNRLKPEKLKPKITLQQVEQDVATAKDLRNEPN